MAITFCIFSNLYNIKHLTVYYVTTTINLYSNVNVNYVSDYYVNNIMKALDDNDSIPMFADYRTHAKTDQTLKITAHTLTPSQNECLTVNGKTGLDSIKII